MKDTLSDNKNSSINNNDNNNNNYIHICTLEVFSNTPQALCLCDGLRLRSSTKFFNFISRILTRMYWLEVCVVIRNHVVIIVYTIVYIICVQCNIGFRLMWLNTHGCTHTCFKYHTQIRCRCITAILLYFKRLL